jgi:hypothetical protein
VTTKPNQRPGGSIGGPSGKHANKHARIPSTDDERAAWKLAASHAGLSFAPWARRLLNAEAKRLGFEPPDKVDDE